MILLPYNPPVFEIGQIVRHRRYGYRGVIVAYDPTCQAPESWYQNNRTQPDRFQPWYHVLVHRSSEATYTAESNLEEEQPPQPISHALAEQFFHNFDGTRYVRNDTSWPGWE